MDFKDLPKRVRSEKKLIASYSLLMTPEMKKALDEMKTFEQIDVPHWIRSMIQEKLVQLGKLKI